MAKYLKHDMSAIMPEFREHMAVIDKRTFTVDEMPLAALSEANKKKLVSEIKAAGYSTAREFGRAIKKKDRTSRERLKDIGTIRKDELIALYDNMNLKICRLLPELDIAKLSVTSIEYKALSQHLERIKDGLPPTNKELLYSEYTEKQDAERTANCVRQQIKKLEDAKSLIQKYGMKPRDMHPRGFDEELFARAMVESLNLIGEDDKRTLAGVFLAFVKDTNEEPLKRALAYLRAAKKPNEDEYNTYDGLIALIKKDCIGLDHDENILKEYLGII